MYKTLQIRHGQTHQDNCCITYNAHTNKVLYEMQIVHKQIPCDHMTSSRVLYITSNFVVEKHSILFIKHVYFCKFLNSNDKKE